MDCKLLASGAWNGCARLDFWTGDFYEQRTAGGLALKYRDAYSSETYQVRAIVQEAALGLLSYREALAPC
jgi:hypothetical protein